jgi:hypothetical protein
MLGVKCNGASHCSLMPKLAARSSYAKDCEHSSSGRSPGFWLQPLLISPSGSIGEQWLNLFHIKRMSNSPVTVARETAPELHRLPLFCLYCRPPDENKSDRSSIRMGLWQCQQREPFSIVKSRGMYPVLIGRLPGASF